VGAAARGKSHDFRYVGREAVGRRCRQSLLVMQVFGVAGGFHRPLTGSARRGERAVGRTWGPLCGGSLTTSATEVWEASRLSSFRASEERVTGWKPIPRLEEAAGGVFALGWGAGGRGGFGGGGRGGSAGGAFGGGRGGGL
jgi:hypothetical protein